MNKPFDFDKEKQRCEEIAPKYFSEKLKGVDEKYNKAALKKILPMCHGLNILELGCGEGLWTEALLQVFDRVVVVDASKSLIRNLQHKFGNKVICYHSLFEEFEAEDKFDTILAAHIFEHIQDPVTLLKRIATWLNIGGHLIILVPNAGSLHRRVGKQMGILKDTTRLSDSDRFAGHRRVYTLETLTGDIIKSGLKVIRTGGLTLKPLSNAQMERWPDDLLNAYLSLGEDIPEYAGQIYAVCSI